MFYWAETQDFINVVLLHWLCVLLRWIHQRKGMGFPSLFWNLDHCTSLLRRFGPFNEVQYQSSPDKMQSHWINKCENKEEPFSFLVQQLLLLPILSLFIELCVTSQSCESYLLYDCSLDMFRWDNQSPESVTVCCHLQKRTTDSLLLLLFPLVLLFHCRYIARKKSGPQFKWYVHLCTYLPWFRLV